MFERVLTVKYLTFKNSFIYLPSSLKYFKTGSYVQLTYGENKIAYFSITTSMVKLDDNSVGLNSLYAKTLGIKENELVILSEISQLPTVNSIMISPINNHDYEILEMLAENIQATLLDQIRVVNTGQKFVVWIGVNIHAVVYLENIIWTDESCINSYGIFNRNNNHHYSQNNSHATATTNRQSRFAFSVWCGLINNYLVRPYFFHENIYFQQHGASAHNARQTRAYLDEGFLEKWIGTTNGPIRWPVRVCDITPPDFWLWDYLKNIIYKKRSNALEELMNRTRDIFLIITPLMIKNDTASRRTQTI